jgi:hypothetical protein
MSRRLVLLAAACAVLAGCGGANGSKLIEQTAAKVGNIKSGRLDLALLVTPRGAGGQQVGFRVSGPFALPKAGQLPVAKLRYTQVLGSREATLTLVSDGVDAFVVVNGQPYQLSADQVEQLRGTSGALQTGGLAQLRVGDWVRSPRTGPCGSIAPGANVDCVHGSLDVANAVNDLLQLGRDLGRSVPILRAGNERQIRRAVGSSTVVLAAGHDNHLLRALAIDVHFRPKVPDSLRESLGSLVGGKLHFTIAIASPNRPVHVTAPQNALPFDQLKKTGGG